MLSRRWSCESTPSRSRQLATPAMMEPPWSNHAKFTRVTDGYDVTETDLRVDEFEVKASCAPGYTGSAMVTKCSGATDKVATSYTLDGCTSTSKRAPNQKIFCVAPAVTDGYDVTETDLREHVFQVTARCAAGYSGTAKVYRCTGSTEEVATSYTLSGCTRR